MFPDIIVCRILILACSHFIKYSQYESGGTSHEFTSYHVPVRKLVPSSIKKLLELYAGARSNTLAPVYHTIALCLSVGARSVPPEHLSSRLKGRASRRLIHPLHLPQAAARHRPYAAFGNAQGLSGSDLRSRSPHTHRRPNHC